MIILCSCKRAATALGSVASVRETVARNAGLGALQFLHDLRSDQWLLLVTTWLFLLRCDLMYACVAASASQLTC